MQCDVDAANEAGASVSAPAAVDISWDVDALPDADEGQVDSEPAGVSWDDGEHLKSTAEAGATGISWDVEAEAPSTADAEDGPAGISWDIGADPATSGVTEGAAAESGADMADDRDWGVEVADEGADGAGGISIDWDTGDDGGAGGAELSGPEASGVRSSQRTHATDVTGTLIADSDFRNRCFEHAASCLVRLIKCMQFCKAAELGTLQGYVDAQAAGTRSADCHAHKIDCAVVQVAG